MSLSINNEVDLIRLGIRMSALLRMLKPDNGYSDKFDNLFDEYMNELQKKVENFANG